MTDRELDAQAVNVFIEQRVFGRDVCRHVAPIVRGNGLCKACGLPQSRPFAGDMNAAFEMEEKIRELGLEARYAEALFPQIAYRPHLWATDVFRIAHASAEERCRAVREILEEKQ